MNAQELSGSLNQISFKFFIVRSLKASKYSTGIIRNYNYDYNAVHIAATQFEANEVFEKFNSDKSILEHYEIWYKVDGRVCRYSDNKEII